MRSLGDSTETKKAKNANLETARLVENGKELVRCEVFETIIFYPTKDWWNLDGNIGKWVCDTLVLGIDWEDEEGVEEWRKWYESWNCKKLLRSSHTRRRRTVVEGVKKTFVGAFAGNTLLSSNWRRSLTILFPRLPQN